MMIFNEARRELKTVGVTLTWRHSNGGRYCVRKAGETKGHETPSLEEAVLVGRALAVMPLVETVQG